MLQLSGQFNGVQVFIFFCLNRLYFGWGNVVLNNIDHASSVRRIIIMRVMFMWKKWHFMIDSWWLACILATKCINKYLILRAVVVVVVVVVAAATNKKKSLSPVKRKHFKYIYFFIRIEEIRCTFFLILLNIKSTPNKTDKIIMVIKKDSSYLDSLQITQNPLIG